MRLRDPAAACGDGGASVRSMAIAVEEDDEDDDEDEDDDPPAAGGGGGSSSSTRLITAPLMCFVRRQKETGHGWLP